MALIVAVGSGNAAFGDNLEGASDLGVDYAFMSLMTLSRDFAADKYTIDQSDRDVHISISPSPIILT
jgi:hypothetical protein